MLLCNRISKSTSGKDDKKQGLSRLSLHIVENVSVGIDNMAGHAVKKEHGKTGFSAWLKR